MSLAAERALAERMRLGLGTRAPIPDLLGLVESVAGVRVVMEHLGADGIAGAYAARRGVPFILLNSDSTLVRLRFTLAHEYGHHVLGHGLSIDREISFGATLPQEEVQANAFAAEFLLPLDALEVWLRDRAYAEPDLALLVELAHDFLVSAQVACYRMRSAGRLTGRAGRALERAVQAGEHLAVKTARARFLPDSLRDARLRQRRLPADAEDLLLRAVERGLLDAEEAGARLRLPPDEVARRLAGIAVQDLE